MSLDRALLLVAIAALAGVARAADMPDPKTRTVEPAPFRVVVELKGVFESAGMTEIRLRPKVWTTLEVKKVVPQGTVVAVGDPLLWLETEDLENSIQDAQLAVQLGQLSLAQAASELKTLQASVPLDMEAARRAQSESQQDLDYEKQFGEEMTRRIAENSLQRSQQQVEYSAEELRQLEKMYKADDLTEESEEIVLERTRHELEQAKFGMELAKTHFDKSIQFDIPRGRVRTEDAVARADLALQKAHVTLPASIEQQRIDVQKLEHAQQELEKKLARLQQDLQGLTVVAPAAGVVRYGQAERGRWKTASQLESQLREGGTVPANQTLFTILTGDRMLIRVDVPEAELHACTPGKAGIATPTGFPEARLTCKLEEVSLISTDDVFDGRMSFTGSTPSLTAGMTCTVKLTAYSSESALSVPTASIFAEEANPDAKYVYLPGDPPPKRAVRLGNVSGDRTEILEGLQAGDKILLEKPAP